MSLNVMAHGLMIIMMATFQTGRGLNLRIDISPDFIIEKVEKSADITCRPDAFSYDEVRQVVVMEIIKEPSEALVTMREHYKMVLGNETGLHLTAKGLVSRDVSKSYLNLTLLNPRPDDSARYTCVMFYMDASGMFKDVRVSQELTVESYDIPRLIQHLRDSLAYVKSNIRKMSSDDSIVTARVDKLEETAEDNSQIIKNLTDKVAFYASRDGRSVYTARQVIVFSKLIMREGHGYDATTGVFTSPRAGLYNFHLFARIVDRNNYLEIRLMVNDTVDAVLTLGDDRYGDQASISSVVVLNEGDTVKPVVNTKSGTARLNGNPFSGFSGYLVKPM